MLPCSATALRLTSDHGDGDADLVGGAAEDGGELLWFENTDGAATTWTAHPIAIGLMISLDGGDIDRDGDVDLLVSEGVSASQPANVVSWFENVAGDGSTWTEHLIGVGPNGAGPSRDVQLADLDRDGDLDAAGAANGAWCQNVSGDASSWSEHPADPAAPSASPPPTPTATAISISSPRSAEATGSCGRRT